MRRIMTILLVLISLPLLSSGTIRMDMNFSPENLEFHSIVDPLDEKGVEFDKIALGVRSAVVAGVTPPGTPAIGGVGRSVIVPPDATITEIEVIKKERVEIEGNYNIYPVQKNVAFSNPYPRFTPPDEIVYSSNELFPGKIVRLNGTSSMSGYRIGGFMVYPLQYVPTEGKVYLYTDIELEIKYESGRAPIQRMNDAQIELFRKSIEKMVVNKEDIERFTPRRRGQTKGSILLPPDTVEYVIIAPASDTAEYDTLLFWKEKKGIKNPKTVALDWIYNNYSVAGDTNKIANFVADAETTWGTMFFIIGGDCAPTEKVPIAQMRADYTSDPPITDRYYSETDLYLDGTEPGDPGAAELEDVVVTRFTAENNTEIATFIKKTLGHERNPVYSGMNPDYDQPVMYLPTYQLWSDWTGDVCADTIAEQTPAGWKDSICYTTNSPSLSEMNATDQSGIRYKHQIGHGSDTYWNGANQGVSDVSSFTNFPNTPIVTQICCHTGDIGHSSDCFSEAFIENPDGGVGGIQGNTRYGLGSRSGVWDDENESRSSGLCTDFYRYQWPWGSDRTIGEAWLHSKNYVTSTYISGHSDDLSVWSRNDIEVLGDAELTLHSSPHLIDTLEGTHPATAPVGPSSFTVTVEASGVAVENAKVCLWCKNEPTMWKRGYTNSSGQVNISVNPSVVGDTMWVTASKSTYKPYEGYATITSQNQPYPVYNHSDVTAGTDDVISPGESVDAGIWVKNVGTQNAYGVYGLLSTTDGYVNGISVDSAYFGDIPAGDSVLGAPDYEFDVDITTPDQHTLSFDLVTHDNDDSTVTSHPSYTVYAPDFTREGVTIDDSPGNNDGIWDPGEQVNLILNVSNSGHLDASSVTATLETSDSYVTINTANSNYPDIAQGAQGDNSSNPFVATSGGSTPAGHVAEFDAIFTYNGGMVDTVSFSTTIGIEGVDWANHDIGDTKLTVTRYGSIGFMSDAQSQGDGWSYPISGSNGLFIGSFAAGTGTNWVADRFYGSPSGEKSDWETTSSPDGMVRMGVGGYSDQNSTARFGDTGHPSSMGLEVEQLGWAWGGGTWEDDFVILKYVIHNTSGSAVNDIYFGVFLDLDVGSYTSNIGGVDENRSMAFVLESGGSTYYGVRVLEDSVSGNRRASLIYNSDDVYPWSGTPDSLMFCFMDGSLHRDTSGTYGANDYGANACVGPTSIGAGESDTVGFALVGGNSLSELQINSDTAFSYYWQWYSGIEEEEIPEVFTMDMKSVLSSGGIKIRYSLPEASDVTLRVYDCTGREIKSMREKKEAGWWETRIDMKNKPAGVYFIRMEASGKRFTRKAVLLR